MLKMATMFKIFSNTGKVAKQIKHVQVTDKSKAQWIDVVVWLDGPYDRVAVKSYNIRSYKAMGLNLRGSING